MKIHNLIESSDELAAICERMSAADFITVDTEFMRESTYYPLLCLIQISDGKEAAAIDPLARGIDLGPLLDLLVDNEDVLKVFHAGGQDVEIIYNLTGKTPHPIFDTQIAAMALGQGEQIGYGALVESWCNVALDKGARFTDWSRRPLDKRQLTYAIGDVTYLAEIFPQMVEKLVKLKRGDWLDEEMERLANPRNYANDPQESWKRIKLQSRKADVLGRLKALAAWREIEASEKNLPRGRIMKDETLADIAGNPPKSQDHLAKVRGLSPAWAKNDIGDRLMEVLENAEPLSREDIPPRKNGPSLGKEGSLVADLLKLLLKIRSREMDVASRLITRADELDMLAAGEREGLAILAGWRLEAFGQDALDLVEGRLAFAVCDGKLEMTRAQV